MGGKFFPGSSSLPKPREARLSRPEGDGVEPIYDGTAELWWDSVEAMEAAFASEEGKIAGVDADKFAEVRIHIYTEEHVVVPRS